MSPRNLEFVDHWILQFGLTLPDSARSALVNWVGDYSSIQYQATFWDKLGELIRDFPSIVPSVHRLAPFFSNLRSPMVFLAFLERDRDALPVLLRILALDSPAVDWLVEDPDLFDWLRLTAGQVVDAAHLQDVLVSELKNLDDEQHWLATMRTFRKRETLRLICAFCLHGMPWHDFVEQLSHVADAAVAGCVAVVNASQEQRGAEHSRFDDEVAVLGLGAYGGKEIDLCNPLELIFLSESDSGRGASSNRKEELDRFASRVVEWLAHPEGFGYQVVHPLRVEISSPEEVHVASVKHWLQSIENQGRTKHRLLLLKTRFVRGNRSLADNVSTEIPTLIFNRYLTGSDIAGFGALYRRLRRDGVEIDSLQKSPEQWSTSIVFGWRHELLFLVQYLQLLHGGDLESIRCSNTMDAIEALALAGFLQEDERTIMQTALLRFEHALIAMQIRSVSLLKVQENGEASNVELPWNWEELRAIAGASRPALDSSMLIESISRVRLIIHHLLGEVGAEGEVSEETDLILDPQPAPNWVDSVLVKHHFERTHSAFQHLRELSHEEIPMLSTRRCRHFLARIAPQLLSKIGQTPSPDLTLENLASTCRSLGGKGILWELFSVHEPSLDLYVRLCGASPYLVSILNNNPGMVDELLDSLMLHRLPNEHQLENMLHELCRGAEDIEPILSSFKNAMHLNVGVRDILGKERVQDTHRALSDIADVCLHQVSENTYNGLVRRFGIPHLQKKSIVDDGDARENHTDERAVCRYCFLTLGKYGTRQPNYHSDMSLLCIYEDEGSTASIGFSRHHDAIDCEHFFHQLSQRTSQALHRLSRNGRLYEAKSWILESGHGNQFAWSVPALRAYLSHSNLSTMQRVHLATSRPVVGDPAFHRIVQELIHHYLKLSSWTPQDTANVRAYRHSLEETASPLNLKRGTGGTLDIELLCQVLTFQNAERISFCEGTFATLDQLEQTGILNQGDSQKLRESYGFLRRIESGLRLMNTSLRHDVPSDANELERLAYVVGFAKGKDLLATCSKYREWNRELFLKHLVH